MKVSFIFPVHKGKGCPITCRWRDRMESRGMALPLLNRGARWGWVVSAMHWPLYHKERPGTHYTGSWVDSSSLSVCFDKYEEFTSKLCTNKMCFICYTYIYICVCVCVCARTRHIYRYHLQVLCIRCK